MIRLTRRGLALLAAAVVVFAVGQLVGYPVLLALAAAALGAVLAAVAVISRRPKVTVSREVYPERVERGHPAFASLLVRNTGTRRQTGFSAGDRLGTGFHAVTVRPLAAGADAVYRYELPTTTRGRHKVGPLTMERADPLGLTSSRLTTGDTTTVWVHPRILPVRVNAGGHPRHHHEGATTDESLRGSLDLREVRPYVPGDEVRHLHWKATAKTGQLMVRDYIDPNQPRFTAVLDTRAAGPLFEEAADITASLIAAAARAEHRARLITPSGIDIATMGGATALRQLLDELCVLEPGGAGSPLLPSTFGDTGGRLVVVTAGATANDCAAIGAQRSRFATVTVIALGAGQPPRIPGATVLAAAGAEDAIRRWNGVG